MPEPGERGGARPPREATHAFGRAQQGLREGGDPELALILELHGARGGTGGRQALGRAWAAPAAGLRAPAERSTDVRFAARILEQQLLEGRHPTETATEASGS